ncbi:hypothetical protein KY386_02635 [Candidatus Parcubacteria bacterium]|nr:hypothetical protein [Candidatus Parcubacteria bacterium]
MSLTEIQSGRYPEADSFRSAGVYQDLAGEPVENGAGVQAEQVDVAFRQPTAEEFQANFEDIMETLRPPGSDGRREGRKKAVETYVEGEEVYRLQAQAAMLIDAKKMLDLQRQVNGGRIKDQAELGLAKRRLTEYHHLVRDVIMANPAAVFKSTLTDWLSTASGDSRWSEHHVNGIAGELALAEALNRDGRLGRARLTSIEQDRDGMDVVLLLSHGRERATYLGIDVKTRSSEPLPEEEVIRRPKSGEHEVLEVALAAGDISDTFQLYPAAAHEKVELIADQINQMGHFAPARAG